MDPQQFLDKWRITHEVLAVSLGASERAVGYWTASPQAKTRKNPTAIVLTSILLLDQLWTVQGKKPGQKLIDLIRETTAA